MRGRSICASAVAILALLAAACSSSGGGKSANSAVDTPAGSGGAASSAVETSPSTSGGGGGGGGGTTGDACSMSGADVSAIVGFDVQDGTATSLTCTWSSADHTQNVAITSSSSMGDESASVEALTKQFGDLKPISGESHAYTISSLAEILMFANDKLYIVVGVDDQAKALALLKAYAG
jgi:hypothetical protein